MSYIKDTRKRPHPFYSKPFHAAVMDPGETKGKKHITNLNKTLNPYFGCGSFIYSSVHSRNKW